jgi:hypothetical protein
MGLPCGYAHTQAAAYEQQAASTLRWGPAHVFNIGNRLEVLRRSGYGR